MTNLLWRLGLGFNRFVLTWDQNGFYVPTYVRLPAVGTMQHSSTGMHVHSSVCVCACLPLLHHQHVGCLMVPGVG